MGKSYRSGQSIILFRKVDTLRLLKTEATIPNHHPGMYQLYCSCNGRYICKLKKKVSTQCIDHQQDRIKGNRESSSATEHTKEHHERFNWILARTIALMSNMHKRNVDKALEINRLKTLNEVDKTFKVLNRDNGDYITTNSCKPLSRKRVKGKTMNL